MIRGRRCIFVATTNEQAYLRDPTGNRRWWPVKVVRADWDLARQVRDQLWAEACVAEAAGEVLVLPESLWGVAAIEQQRRMEIDPWADIISDRLRPFEEKRKDVDGKFWSGFANKQCEPEFRVASSYLLTEVLGLAGERQGGPHSRRLAGLMRGLGWRLAQGPIKVGKASQRAYTKPQEED